MTQLRVGSGIAWVPWSHSAFQRAHDERKLVLLSLTVPWSAACREMDRTSYAAPGVVEEIHRWFIPVRVDADRRPDIADRYELGGLPTTAFLDADGRLLGGGTFVPPERLIEALRHVTRLRDAPTAVSPKVPGSEDGPTLTDDELADLVFSSFDRAHAGFGGAPKFPLAAPVHLALELGRQDEATRTLDAMAWGGLYDDERGGFFRCAGGSDWTDPAPEKLLLVNAALLELYLHAGVVTGNERWLARAADVLEFAQGQLAVGPGRGWRTSTDTDDVCYADANAAMASAALRASTVFQDDTLRQTALQSLEGVLLESYRPGAGVAHCRGGVAGLLADHVAMAAAHLDAWDLTGDEVYQMMAQELVEFLRRSLLCDDAFVDRAGSADDVGKLTEPLIPFVWNCQAAEVLHRLGRATGDQAYLELATRVLESMRPRAAAHGPLAAHFLLARRSLSR